MDNEIVQLKGSMIEFKTKLTNTENTVKRIEDKLDTFIEKADTKFAAKWTEKLLIWGGCIVGATILIAFMSLILKDTLK